MFTFKKWNGEYGAGAKFVTEDDDTGKQCMFTPGKTQDIVWTTSDLSATPEVKDWQDFGEEQVENLEDVAF